MLCVLTYKSINFILEFVSVYYSKMKSWINFNKLVTQTRFYLTNNGINTNMDSDSTQLYKHIIKYKYRPIYKYQLKRLYKDKNKKTYKRVCNSRSEYKKCCIGN